MIRKIVISAGLSMLPMGTVFAGSWVIPQNCGQCALGTPLPDQNTQNILDAFGNPSYPLYTGSAVYNPGDSVTICNAIGCATYTVAENKLYGSGQYQGGQDHTPPRGGGGGGGVGVGGGGGGGGTVTVGPDEPVHDYPESL